MSEVQAAPTVVSAPAPAPVAPAPGGVPPAAPATTTPAPETVTINKADLDRYTRYEQQVKGYAPVLQTLGQYGLRTPEDVSREFGNVVAIREAGIDPSKLSGASRTQPTQAQPTQAPSHPNGVYPIAYTDHALAKLQYANAYENESAMVESLVRELVGTSPTEHDLTVAGDIVRGAMSRLPDSVVTYPKGHPLSKEYLKPLGATDFKQVAESAKKTWTAWNGARLQNLGNAASAAPRPPVAGLPGQGPGSPASAPSLDERARQIAEQTANALRGGPMSMATA